ncbi:hypothetical protein [Brasilonema bromeliae]|uniref:Transferase hexapeptide repeat containing protein n=1 Tax=Brasilonema bromeliae SPC951 TaxID=385972 RepID=A0ABX1PFM9_9CYAN|nr:hypothetical protein [Brasilonema bromeliae]NMG23104.1 hypothetical protein [Brasilonema bromeliae SPC951]
MSTPEIEARLAILEAEVARLKQQLPVSSIPWWQTILGSFANDPAYDEAMQLGQQYRQSLRPDSDSSGDI